MPHKEKPLAGCAWLLVGLSIFCAIAGTVLAVYLVEVP